MVLFVQQKIAERVIFYNTNSIWEMMYFSKNVFGVWIFYLKHKVSFTYTAKKVLKQIEQLFLQNSVIQNCPEVFVLNLFREHLHGQKENRISVALI